MKPTDRPIVFRGVDGWNRPVFKRVQVADEPHRFYYGSTGILFDYDAPEAQVLEKVTEKDLCFFGNSFDCEPDGTPLPDGIRIVTQAEAKEITRKRKAAHQ